MVDCRLTQHAFLNRKKMWRKLGMILADTNEDDDIKNCCYCFQTWLREYPARNCAKNIWANMEFMLLPEETGKRTIRRSARDFVLHGRNVETRYRLWEGGARSGFSRHLMRLTVHVKWSKLIMQEPKIWCFGRVPTRLEKYGCWQPFDAPLISDLQVLRFTLPCALFGRITHLGYGHEEFPELKVEKPVGTPDRQQAHGGEGSCNPLLLFWYLRLSEDVGSGWAWAIA